MQQRENREGLRPFTLNNKYLENKITGTGMRGSKINIK